MPLCMWSAALKENVFGRFRFRRVRIGKTNKSKLQSAGADQLSDGGRAGGARMDHQKRDQGASGGREDPFGLRTRIYPCGDREL